ncbi:DNA glycosylase [Exidia glandulosa HHB12029]|uniref:DNA-(apurinic or apyrimidinic site) lyase n=1 Tax=Exidia glandulosa HHB12029 TaxID=1314781 RepID=A0A165KM08_EXIGL|nr:DNA glycosylase [Exidia glandulosa HHB12029]
MDLAPPLDAPTPPARRRTNAETSAGTPTPRKAKSRAATSSSKVVDHVMHVALETKHETDEQAALPTSKGKKKADASPKKQKPIQMELAVPHPAPEHWREVYDLIHQMCEGVDTPAELEGDSDPKTKRFVTLIALMLSSQTRDEVTHAAVGNLRTALNGLTLESVLAAEDSVISAAIAKVRFWRRKTEYIKKTSQKLKDDYDGDVPKTVEELCSLPGVGPKTAFLCLQSAWKLNVGIGVDTHVHRITNRLGWHKPPTTTPEQTRHVVFLCVSRGQAVR